jgi:hypothetical protein
MMPRKANKRAPDPTPAEIEERAAVERKRWSESRWLARGKGELAGEPMPLEVPRVSARWIAEEIEELRKEDAEP